MSQTEPQKTIVCFGPGPRFKGGLSDYNTALAKTLDRFPGTTVHIVSWTQQYPAIIPREFVDKSSKEDFLEGTDIRVKYITNFNNPFSWWRTVQYIRSLAPDMVIFQWAIAVQGLPLGLISRKLTRDAGTEVIFDLHFVKQKEESRLDRLLTKWGIRGCDTYIVHAYKIFDELSQLFPDRSFEVTETGDRDLGKKAVTPVLKLYHPVYDLFRPDPSFDVEGYKEKLGLARHVFLFFGFIRPYKGLHQAIRAFKKVAEQRDDVSFLICGESFWNTLDAKKLSTRLKHFLFGLAKKLFLSDKKEDEEAQNPLSLIDDLGLRDRTVVVNEFIPNEDLHKYFQVSDGVVLYYLTATPSGIESLSYNFKVPLLATKVGHFPETIDDGFNGYLAEAGDIDSMARQMNRLIEHPLPPENVEKKTREMSWENYSRAILRPYTSRS